MNKFNVYEKWCKLPDKLRFLFVGCVNAGISYSIFVFAIYLIGHQHYQACLILQWTLSSVISYFNQKIFVFCTKGNYATEYLKCCSTWAISYLLNVVILELLVKFAIKNVYLSQFISIFLVSVVTYILFKYFAFRPRNYKQ